MNSLNEIILYQPDSTVQLEVRLENETVWLSLDQIADLFQRDKSTISRHLKNALREELAGFSVVANFATTENEQAATVAKFTTVQKDNPAREISVVAKFATTAADGKKYQVEYYNLDVIISVGYRVKSPRGIQFRQWANRILKEYLLKGYAVPTRAATVEQRVMTNEHRLTAAEHRLETTEQRLANAENKIDFFVKTALPPVEGIFYDGQIFDAYVFAADLIKSAKKSLVLIDNYIDESVLLLFAKRAAGVAATIYTAKISAQLQKDLDKHREQYPPIELRLFKKSHDRFLLIDHAVYHLGASLKDLGKRWFAFSKMEWSAAELLQRLA
ncbi:MAG: virulence RhuM family protein [Planctomycetota bacterium]|jgi:hypothetical protein|nr:virulence RhuM family protein [Planctomycetota bacterium]